jgi:hypothetical protein
MLNLNSTTDRTDLECRLIALLSDATDAARALDSLADDDLAYDLGVELHSARKALQRVYDLFDAAAQPTDRYTAEPRSAQTPAGLVTSYAA